MSQFLRRTTGNFGVSFFTPLVGMNLGDTFFQQYQEFHIVIIKAGLAALVYTGLAISRELLEIDKQKRE